MKKAKVTKNNKMPQTQKKPTKKSPTNIGVFKTKSKLKLTFLVAAGILLFTTIGYAGYNYWNAYHLKAQADSGQWTELGNSKGIQGYMLSYTCKHVINSNYGPLWEIKVVNIRSKGSPILYTIGEFTMTDRGPGDKKGDNSGSGSNIIAHTDFQGAWWGGYVQGFTMLYPVGRDERLTRLVVQPRSNNGREDPLDIGTYGRARIDNIAICS